MASEEQRSERLSFHPQRPPTLSHWYRLVWAHALPPHEQNTRMSMDEYGDTSVQRTEYGVWRHHIELRTRSIYPLLQPPVSRKVGAGGGGGWEEATGSPVGSPLAKPPSQCLIAG